MGGKSGAGLSRRGISGSVKGLWRTCDVLLIIGKKNNNTTFWCVVANGRTAGGLNGSLYDVPMIRLLIHYLLTTNGAG